MSEPANRRPGIPRSVWALGFVSLLMDTSSEAVHAVLPLFLVSTLGASTIAVGLIEGFAEAIASITKLFSGTLSDRLGKRKLLTVTGYGLSAITKPVFALAGRIDWVIVARFTDRVGKGIRGAPRDALVADLTPPEIRGAAFGLRQSLDTVGALLGPALALVVMSLSRDSFRLTFWVATVPAALAVLLLVSAVHEPSATRKIADATPTMSLRTLRRLGRPYWVVMLIVATFSLARFSEAFLLLRGESLGMKLAAVPIVMIVMNAVYAVSAWPAGAASDRLGRAGALAVGLVLLVLADALLAVAGGVTVLLVGVALWGLHMGFTQGVLSAMVADRAPSELRGTAFGMTNLVLGFSALAASTIAGSLWHSYGPSATFAAGATFAFVALLALPATRAPVAPHIRSGEQA
ncbi:MAG: MFS transporter [Fimbriimonadia bacterium]